MRFHLTERFVSSLKGKEGRSPIFRDNELVGFGVQVRSNGRKSFTLDYVIDGRRRRMFIGDYPDWTATAAREEAKRQKRDIDLGHDPLAQRDGRRSAPTMKDLIERYIEEHGARLAPDHARDQRNMLRKYVLPVWGNRKVMDIRTYDVDRLLTEIAKGRARPSKAVTKQKRCRPLAAPKLTPI